MNEDWKARAEAAEMIAAVYFGIAEDVCGIEETRRRFKEEWAKVLRQADERSDAASGTGK